MMDVAHPGPTTTAVAGAFDRRSRTLANLRDGGLLAVIATAEAAWLGLVVYAVLRFFVA